jgi:tyrosyl-tRNA synthetase
MDPQHLSREQLQERILDYLATRDTPPIHGLADFHAEVMKDAFPSEKGIPQRTFSKRALFDEALDELIAEGFVEKRENGRYFLTQKGEAMRH